MTWLLTALVLVGLTDAHLAAEKIAYYREPPWGACRFVQEQFGATPDPWQEQGLVAFVDPRIQRISLQACAGPGKTCFDAWCGWYFLGTQVSRNGLVYEHPKGFATSITGENLRDNLWAEFAKWQSASEYLRRAFTWGADRIYQNEHAATWFLSARAWPKTGSADEQGRTFSGLHGKNVLVLVDESGAIPSTIMRAAEQALPNTHFGKLLQSGNPISLDGMLYEAANARAGLWHIIRVTGDPEDPTAWVHSPRVATVADGQQSPADWAREQIKEYGRENPWVQAYILGRFPPASLNTLLSLEDVVAAMDRQLEPHQYQHSQKRIGVDVARFGDDRTVLFPRQGLAAFRPVVMRNVRTTEIAARVYSAKAKWGSELEIIDASNYLAAGVIDQLQAAGVHTIPISFSGKALEPRFKNLRAEMWFAMAKAIKDGAALPNVAELRGELTTPTYMFNNGLFQLEEKPLVKKRLGRSPDLGDALACTYALPDMPAQMLQQLVEQHGGSRALTDYDPYRRVE